MTDEQFLKMTKLYEHELSIERAFSGAKYDHRSVLRCHEYIERRKTRIALERIIELLEKKKR